jgi:type III pantothenate kinase
VIDIGNSRTKIGVFFAGHLQWQEVLPGRDWSQIMEAATNPAPDNIILSTVGEEPPEGWREAVGQKARFHLLDEHTAMPFRLHYRTPGSLGRDRLAAVAGTLAFHPGRNCLVVDAGTCITADLLTADATFRGGNISPGLRMRLRSMHEMTARLPLVDIGAVDTMLGDSTETALRNGALLGAALEIEGLAARLRPEMPGLQVVLTGGDSPILAGLLKSRIFVHPDLVLYGLDKILTYNVKSVA